MVARIDGLAAFFWSVPASVASGCWPGVGVMAVFYPLTWLVAFKDIVSFEFSAYGIGSWWPIDVMPIVYRSWADLSPKAPVSPPEVFMTVFICEYSWCGS